MKNENSVIAILAAAGGALCSYGAKLVVPLAVLLLVMVADYVSGMAKAWSTGTLCSRIGLRGILKKLGYLALVGVAGVVDWLVRYGLAQTGVEVTFQFLVDLAAIGFGVAGVTEEFVRKELDSGRLKKLKTSFEIPARSVDMCLLSDVPQSAAAERFTDFVKDSLSKL